MGSGVVEETTFINCSPADFAEDTAVDANAVAAVVAAPKTLPECLRVCLRMTSGYHETDAKVILKSPCQLCYKVRKKKEKLEFIA